MPIQDFPVIAGSLPERRRERFFEALPQLEAGLAAGEIANARYVEIKQDFSRIIEKAWEERVRKPYAWNREYMQAALPEEKEALDEFSWPPQTNTIAKMNRLAAELPDTEAGRAIKDILTEATPLLDMVKAGKGVAVKRQAAAPREDIVEKYQAPAASRTVMGEILGELQATTEEARQQLADGIAGRYRNLASRFMDAYGEHLENPDIERRRFDTFTFAKVIGGGKADSRDVSDLNAVIDSRYAAGGTAYSMKPDAEEIIGKRSIEEADRICRAYVEKNMAKLAPIVEGRSSPYAGMEVLGRRVSPASMDGRLRISFEDGASFEARSQAVFHNPDMGSPYVRFPLTFHDVRMPDGSMMSRPSEKKMNEEFARNDQEEPRP